MNLTIIAALGNKGVIGKNNDLIWHMPHDLKRFKKLTKGHHLIMGRKTFESMGKPLPGRVNIVVTRDENYKASGCIVVNTLKAALQKAENDDQPFVVGGAEIYRQALPYTDTMELTYIKGDFEGDTYFPPYDEKEWQLSERESYEADDKNPYPYDFVSFTRKK